METGRLVGQTIDQFYITRHIARGGMADVYLARDTTLERDVAFKVMLDALALDPQYVKRFQREARTVARLDHPNIIQVYSTGQTPLGQPYIAMQYIGGGSLRDKLEQLAERGKLLTTEQTLNLARQLAIALSVAHRADVIHRDLKPGNILIRLDGTPVLVDLGIAAVSSSGPKLTQTGGLVGTPAYMSPEQILNQPLDGRSDLYSLGIILYELFAGQRPFDAENVTSIMYKQVHEEPIPLHEIRPDLSPKSLAIVEKLLNKKPADRYETAERLALAIDQSIQTELGSGPNRLATEVLTHLDDASLIRRDNILQPVLSSSPRKKFSAIVQFARRMPIWVIATLLVLVTVIAVFAFLPTDDGRAQNLTITIIDADPTDLTTAVEGGENRLTATEENLALEPTTVGMDTPRPIPTQTILTETAEIVIPTPTAVSEVVAQPVPSTPQADWRNGTLVYLVSQNDTKGLYTLNLESDSGPELLYTLPSDRNVQGPLWSPNGKLIVLYDTLGRLYFVNEVTRQISFSSHECTAPAWSPDGSQIICRSSDPSTFDIVDASSGQLIRRIPRPNGATIPYWSPIEDEIVFAVFDNAQTSIWRMSLDDPVPVLLAESSTENYAPVWSPNGEWIAYQSNDESDLSEIWMMSASGDSFQRLTMTSVNNWSRAPFWSPDGQYIAFVSDQAGGNQPEHGEIFIISVATGEVYQVTETGGRVYNWRVSWKP